MNSFGTTTQPYYAIIDEEGSIILKDGSYRKHGTTELFKNWLISGLALINK